MFSTTLHLDTDKPNEFTIALNNRFQASQDILKEEETTIMNSCKGIKEVLASTSQEIQESKNKKATINNSRTRTDKVKAQSEYTETNKQVKKSTRAEKQKYVEELATTADKAATEGNMRQLYDMKEKLVGKYSKPERPVKDKEGKPITEIQEQRNEWIEHFEELLNGPAPLNPPD
ncbi:unnamed protein product, partial [Schistosoma curassoni]|uniref:Transposase n=1 Tax=Schistosoma curassoni TaxID=6186 RepID=A0A183JTS6_9TREM